MKEISLFIVDAFTSEQFKGNPAGVVLNSEDLTDHEMSQIAKEINLSETVFLKRKNNRYFVRYFTPEQEIGFCGHATISLGWVLGDLKQDFIDLETNIGSITLEFHYQNDKLDTVFMKQITPQVSDYLGTLDEICKVLELSNHDIDGHYPIKHAYTGNWDLLLPIKSKDVIERCKPNMSLLKAFQIKHKITSVHLFTKEKDTYYTRNFAPAVGIDEDPVTGSTTGAFVGYLLLENKIKWNNQVIQVIQLNSFNREGKLVVKVEIKENKPIIYVGGKAVCHMEGKLYLEDEDEKS